MEENPALYYRVWGVDNIAYGPVELPVLVNWVRDGRVLPESWIFREDKAQWVRATEVTELKLLFKSKTPAAVESGMAVQGIKPITLRRVKVFADMEESHLASFLQYMEVLKLRPHDVVFHKGDHGDSMFMVLEGEVRARVMIDRAETTLATLRAGECFGELALIDDCPRSADMIANSDSVLLKISSSALKRLFQEAPALAAPFLMALSRTLTARMRALTKRYEDSIHFARTAAGE